MHVPKLLAALVAVIMAVVMLASAVPFQQQGFPFGQERTIGELKSGVSALRMPLVDFTSSWAYSRCWRGTCRGGSLSSCRSAADGGVAR